MFWKNYIFDTFLKSDYQSQIFSDIKKRELFPGWEF